MMLLHYAKATCVPLGYISKHGLCSMAGTETWYINTQTPPVSPGGKCQKVVWQLQILTQQAFSRASVFHDSAALLRDIESIHIILATVQLGEFVRLYQKDQHGQSKVTRKQRHRIRGSLAHLVCAPNLPSRPRRATSERKRGNTYI